jgi:glycosyltransferase involved in cell wall biosynthesis
LAEPIRVLRVIARLNMGGPALHVAYLSEGLAERGYDTTLVAGSLARGEGSMAYVAESRGVDIVHVDALSREISPIRDALSVLRLARLIREQRPHILHTHTAKAGAVGRLAALLAGDARPKIVVHTFHGHVLRGYFGLPKTLAFRLLERLLARVTTRLVAVSPQVRDDLVELGVAPAERFTVVRLGIELDERLGGSATRDETRALLGIAPETFVVGWVGRMTGVKRTDDVLSAVQQLRGRGVDAALLMVGDGPDRDHVEERSSQLGIIRHCFFLGYQEDVAGWYQAFDAMILPSANEGTPVVVIEALAAGCPVVATSVGGVPDVVHEGVDGFLVPVGDTKAMAERLERLARDPELRRAMGKAGSETVPSRYAVERLVDDVDRLYRTLLAEG